MTGKKPYISNSQVESYTRCGEAYRRRYLEGHIIPPSFALVTGTSVHKGAELNYGQKIETKKDLPASQVKEIVADTYDVTVKNEGIYMNSEERTIGKGKLLGKHKDEAVGLAGLFTEKVAPKYQPAHVEMAHRIELPGSSHDLLVILDLISDKEELEDLKTAAKATNQAAVDSNTQFTFYAMAYENKFKKPPKRIVIDQLIKTKTPTHKEIETSRDVADFDALINRINSVIKGVSAGVFTPATPGSWWCSPKFCGYWETCPYVPKGKTHE